MGRDKKMAEEIGREWGLSNSQIEHERFDMDFADEIEILVSEFPSQYSASEAYDIIFNLSELQKKGLDIGLNYSLIMRPDFGEKYIHAFDTLRSATKENDNAKRSFFSKCSSQEIDILASGITPRDRENEKIDEAFEKDMEQLRKQNSHLTPRDAFLALRGLNALQRKAISDGFLPREASKITKPKELTAMHSLIFQQDISHSAAFEDVMGINGDRLDEIELDLVIEGGMRRSNIKNSLKDHHKDGIKFMKSKDAALTTYDAFKDVIDLNESQISGMKLGLDKALYRDNYCNSESVDLMNAGKEQGQDISEIFTSYRDMKVMERRGGFLRSEVPKDSCLDKVSNVFHSQSSVKIRR